MAAVLLAFAAQPIVATPPLTGTLNDAERVPYTCGRVNYFRDDAFVPGMATLAEPQLNPVKLLALSLKNEAHPIFIMVGGSAELSQQRAKIVIDLFKSEGVDAARIHIGMPLDGRVSTDGLLIYGLLGCF